MPQTSTGSTNVPKQRRVAAIACVLLVFAALSFLLWAMSLNKPSLSVIKAPANERLVTTATVTKNSLHITAGGSRNTNATRDVYVSFIDQTGKTITTKIEVAPFSTHFMSNDFNLSQDNQQGAGTTVSVAYLAKDPAKYVYLAEVTGTANYWESILSSMFGTYLVNPVLFLLCGVILAFMLLFAVLPDAFGYFSARGWSRNAVFLLVILGAILIQIPIYLVLN